MAHSEPTKAFQSRAQRQPCCLPCPALYAVARRTYLVRSLQEVTSQEESFMLDISGYIRERVKAKMNAKLLV